MLKSDDVAAADDVSAQLDDLRSAVASEENRAAAEAAEKTLRAALVQKVRAQRPRDCFSPTALAAFKRKHVAMMAMRAPK